MDGRPAAMPRASALAAPLCFFFFLPLRRVRAVALLFCADGGEHCGQRAQFRQALHLRPHETLCWPVVQRRSLHQPAHRLLATTPPAARGPEAVSGGGGGGRKRRRARSTFFLLCRHSCRASILLRCRHTSGVAFEAARLRTPPTPRGAATFFLLRQGGGSGSARAAGAISATGSISSSGGVASLLFHLLSFN